MRLLLRLVLAAGIYWLKTVSVVPDALGIVGALVAVALALQVVVDWIRTADWEHDARLTRAGNERAHLRRAEAREISAAIREEKRLAKQRRRRAA